eukprot:Em0001g1664a
MTDVRHFDDASPGKLPGQRSVRGLGFQDMVEAPLKYRQKKGYCDVVVGERVPNADRRREAVMGDIKPTMMSEEESDDQNAQTLQRRRPL